MLANFEIVIAIAKIINNNFEAGFVTLSNFVFVAFDYFVSILTD